MMVNEPMEIQGRASGMNRSSDNNGVTSLTPHSPGRPKRTYVRPAVNATKAHNAISGGGGPSAETGSGRPRPPQ